MSVVRAACTSRAAWRLCLQTCSGGTATAPFSWSRRREHFAQPVRSFSLQETIESVAKTQSGLFKFLSESAPVEGIQKLLLNVHETTGLPWWGAIMCTTVLLRSTVTLPLAVYQQYIMAKLENLNLEMPDIAKELKKEIGIAVRRFNWDERMARVQYKRAIKQQWHKLVLRDNCHPFKASLLILFQIPMWISFSVSLRNLIYELPTPSLDTRLTLMELMMGGTAWFPNLTEVDASFILPVALGLTNYAIIEMQQLSKVSVPTKTQRYITNFFKGFSLLMIPIAASVPSCIVLYWTTSSMYGLIQNIVLMSPKVKRWCHIPKSASQLDNPYTHLYLGIKHKYTFGNKSI